MFSVNNDVPVVVTKTAKSKTNNKAYPNQSQYNDSLLAHNALHIDSIRLYSSSRSISWELTIHHLQLDNMTLEATKYPVILSPPDSGLNRYFYIHFYFFTHAILFYK